MSALRILFRSIGQALCAEGLRAVAKLVPFGDVLYDIASAAAQNFQKLRDKERQRAVLQEVVQAALEDVKAEAEATALEVCVGQPEAIRAQVATYLMQVPSLLRQTCKRPSDLSGRTIPPSLSFQKPADWLMFLPTQLPRFQAGHRPQGVGDWELVELLGVGGFGEVWKARHCYFDGIAPVALKFCLNMAAREGLLRHEAAVLNQVMRHGRHPGIVALLDAHLHADPPCLKYEFVEGGDLAGLMREWQPLPITERWEPATTLVAQLAGIVGAAHRLSPPIVHRDLKPANVLVQRGPDNHLVLRVTDFGIGGVATLPVLKAARHGTTTRGTVLGESLRGAHSPLYASPQQMRGELPDLRDDVHALGVLWYQLLIGDLGSTAPTGLWADELAEAGLSRDLVRLLGACVAAKPERRPADAFTLAEQLNAIVSSLKSRLPAAAGRGVFVEFMAVGFDE